MRETTEYLFVIDPFQLHPSSLGTPILNKVASTLQMQAREVAGLAKVTM